MALLPSCVLGPLCLASVSPPIDLPDGFVAEVAAAPPQVKHPMLATLGARGQLFVGDAAGTNLNKAGLEKELPNRILLLTDTNGDGGYDKSGVFADQMTFPQGGVWLGGSLYVASPPGIWKLTDEDGDGVADRREMIVGGFEYTGNGADVHGPFLHPNGRLYWCHGRKGHEVKQKDGTLVHAGLASGIWSGKPDGSDVRWHALSCADNPTEIDFTPEGEIVGTVNLFYASPRGDTLIHWLRGGVYPREDQLEAIGGLPRTLDVMMVAAQGRAAEGRKVFETGKGACTACHRIGNVGNLVGPNLSTIGQIRAERDILESIFFPSATLARDYEARTIETADGQSLVAVIRRSLPDAIVVVDASAQEHTLPRAQITSMQTLPTSLMPIGLDHSLTEEELLDLVAFLRSCK